MSTFFQNLGDALQTKILNAISNPHTAGSGAVYGLLKIAGVIWPAHAPTLDKISDVAVTYGLIQVGQSVNQTTAKVV